MNLFRLIIIVILGFHVLLFSSSKKATITFADGHVLEGDLKFISAYHTGTDGMRIIGTSDSLIFVVNNSESVAFIPISDIKNIEIQYFKRKCLGGANCYIVTRNAKLMLASGKLIRGIIPTNEDLSTRSIFTIGLEVEISPYVYKKFELEHFISRSFPEFTDRERIISINF